MEEISSNIDKLIVDINKEKDILSLNPVSFQPIYYSVSLS